MHEALLMHLGQSLQGLEHKLLDFWLRKLLVLRVSSVDFRQQVLFTVLKNYVERAILSDHLLYLHDVRGVGELL